MVLAVHGIVLSKLLYWCSQLVRARTHKDLSQCNENWELKLHYLGKANIWHPWDDLKAILGPLNLQEKDPRSPIIVLANIQNLWWCTGAVSRASCLSKVEYITLINQKNSIVTKTLANFKQDNNHSPMHFSIEPVSSRNQSSNSYQCLDTPTIPQCQWI